MRTSYPLGRLRCRREQIFLSPPPRLGRVRADRKRHVGRSARGALLLTFKDRKAIMRISGGARIVRTLPRHTGRAGLTVPTKYRLVLAFALFRWQTLLSCFLDQRNNRFGTRSAEPSLTFCLSRGLRRAERRHAADLDFTPGNKMRSSPRHLLFSIFLACSD